MNTISVQPKSLVAPYVAGAEELADNQLVELLRTSVPSHPIECVNWPEYAYAPKVAFRIAHSGKALVVMFEVEEEHLRAVTLEDHGPVWEDSCVEVFLRNEALGGYFNIEINCAGAALAAHRHSRTDAQRFTDEQMARLRHFGSLPHERVDRPEGGAWWMVEVIPLELLGLSEVPEYLEGNFYKCGDCCRRAHFVSWSPIGLPEPNFHCPEFFGRIVFEK